MINENAIYYTVVGRRTDSSGFYSYTVYEDKDYAETLAKITLENGEDIEQVWLEETSVGVSFFRTKVAFLMKKIDRIWAQEESLRNKIDIHKNMLEVEFLTASLIAAEVKMNGYQREQDAKTR